MKAQRGTAAAKAMQKKPDEDAKPPPTTVATPAVAEARDDARERADEAARAASDVEQPDLAEAAAGVEAHADEERSAAQDDGEERSAATGDGITMPRAPAPPAVVSVPNGAQIGAVALGAVACLPFADARAAYLDGFARIAALELELRTATARIDFEISQARDKLKPAEHELCLAMRGERRLVELPDAAGKPVTYKTRARPGIEPKPGVSWLMLQVVKA